MKLRLTSARILAAGYVLCAFGALSACQAVGIGPAIDKQLAAQSAVNTHQIVDDNNALAANNIELAAAIKAVTLGDETALKALKDMAKVKGLDPISAKIYADHAAKAVQVADELAK